MVVLTVFIIYAQIIAHYIYGCQVFFTCPYYFFISPVGIPYQNNFISNCLLHIFSVGDESKFYSYPIYAAFGCVDTKSSGAVVGGTFVVVVDKYSILLLFAIWHYNL